jgi:prolyl 4-hydroxylase
LSQSYDACVNKDKWCAFWAVVDECEGDNKEWMATNCGPVCQTCEQTSIFTKCPLDPNAKNALEPGDLDKLFERIISAEEYKQYEPKVWSRPYYKEGDTAETADYIISAWLVTLENFVTEEEAQRLIELGGVEGYGASTAVGDIQDDGTVELYETDYRTSTNAWCHEECAEDPLATRVSERMGEVVGVPVDYSENFQLLRYETGQFYKGESL